MWFAKWFGGRRQASEAQDDEPARFAAPQNLHQNLQHGSRPGRGAVSPGEAGLRAPAKPKANARTGFDPYNSGAFERRNAWERVNRR